MINAFARVWLSLEVRDTSGAFRCYRVSQLAKLDFGQIQSRGYSVFEELLFRLKPLDTRIRELPITFVDRDLGASKITWDEAVRSVWRIIALRSQKTAT
jgi:dolichol-phosphate mannosyltransferase